MLRALKRIFPASEERSPAVGACYIALLQQARNPFFFRALAVPDSIDGRFDLILLHLFLLVERLQRIPGAEDFSRHLSEEFFDDMDRSLRQLGVMDTGLAKRIKRMGKAYHGRMTAYGVTTDREALKAALARNLYGTLAEGDLTLLDRMADYMARIRSDLAAASDDVLLGGGYAWPDPSAR